MTRPVVYVKATMATLGEVLPFAREQGFDLEIVDLIKPVAFWERFDDVRTTYREALAGFEGVVSLHGPFIDLYLNSLDPRIAELSRDVLRRTMDLSDDLGVPYTIFHGNFLPLIDEEPYRRNWVSCHVDFWRAATQRYRTTLLLENLWDRTPDLFREVCDEVGSPSFGMCLDIGHCSVHSPLDLADWFETLGRHTRILHVNDNDGTRDQELPPGRGVVDWKRLTRLVREHCRSPHVSLELSTLPDVVEGASYLRENGIYPYD